MLEFNHELEAIPNLIKTKLMDKFTNKTNKNNKIKKDLSNYRGVSFNPEY